MTRLVVLTVALAIAAPLSAQDTVTEPVTKTTFDRTWGDPPLKLYGVSDRKRVFFKVYGVGLYADEESVNAKLAGMGGGSSKDALAKAIVASDGSKTIVLKFVRNVSKSRIQGSFRDGIERTVRLTDERIADDAQVLLDAMVDVKKGDTAEFVMTGDGTLTLLGNGDEMVTVQNRLLCDAVLKTYIGENPLHKNIKAKLLSMA